MNNEQQSNTKQKSETCQWPQVEIMALPRNELEKQLISSFIHDPSLVSKHNLNPSEFQTADLRLLYQGIIRARDNSSIDWRLLVAIPGSPTDPMVHLIDQECERLGKIAGVEGSLVHQVATALPAPIQLDQHITRLRADRYVIRKVGKRGKVSLSLNIEALVNDLMAEFTFKTIPGTKGNDDILVYQDGVYTYNGETVIREECEKRIPSPYTELLSTHNVNEVKGHIARSTFVDREKFNTEKYIINLKNGLLDVMILELRPHSPNHLSTIRIPIKYDPGARCPNIEKFLSEVLPPQNIQTILEHFGYALIPDYSIPVVLIYIGDGRNGKTTLLNLERRFIGENNCASVSLHDLENNQFAASHLAGKLLNTQGDLTQEWFGNTGLLKQLSGTDPIHGNRKYRDPITFYNFARLAFSSNKPPKLSDETRAVWTRIAPIEFPNIFEGDRVRKNILDNELALPEELSGLLNLALEEGLHTVMKPDGSFGDLTNLGTIEERAEQYTLSSDTPRRFVEEWCEVGTNYKIPKADLYSAYKVFCKNHGKQPGLDSQFAKALKRIAGVTPTRPREKDGGAQVPHYLGIKLTDEAQEKVRERNVPDWF